jgi:hypothetical protein
VAYKTKLQRFALKLEPRKFLKTLQSNAFRNKTKERALCALSSYKNQD